MQSAINKPFNFSASHPDPVRRVRSTLNSFVEFSFPLWFVSTFSGLTFHGPSFKEVLWQQNESKNHISVNLIKQESKS